MSSLSNLNDYLRLHGDELAQRILASFPPLHSPEGPPSPHISRMLRTPYPAQTLAIMGVAKRWDIARGAHVVAECGAGKTLIALGMMLVHAQGQPFSGIVMAPPHLVEKWARATFLTLSRVRVFLIDDMRNGGDPKQPHGVNEVRLRRARSCAKVCTPRWPICACMGQRDGGRSVRNPRSSSSVASGPSSAISGSMCT